MKKDPLTKIMAVVGTVFTGSPFLIIIFTTSFSFIRSHRFHLDYLIPAEVFPVVLLGGVLLMWAAFRAHSRTKLISGILGSAIFFLVIGQLLAIVSGLASGKIEAEGFWWVIVLGSICLYSLLVAGLCIAGILLIRDLFRKSAPIDAGS